MSTTTLDRFAAWRERRRRARWQQLGESVALAAQTAQERLTASPAARRTGSAVRAATGVLVALGVLVAAVCVGAFALGVSYRARVA